jgi:hypothetical protein
MLLRYFKKQGVPDFFIDELKMKQPEIFIPNHLFQVLHIGVGKASGVVPFNLKSINNCMIRWGKVKKISQNKATISLNSLEKQKKDLETEFDAWRGNLEQVDDITVIGLRI